MCGSNYCLVDWHLSSSRKSAVLPYLEAKVWCFVSFLRQALSMPYAVFPYPWASGMLWTASDSKTHLGRRKSPASHSVPGSLKWAPRPGCKADVLPQRYTKERGSVPNFSTEVPASGLTEQLAPDLVSHHLVCSEWQDSAVQVAPLRAGQRARPRLPGHRAKSPQEGQGKPLQLLRLYKKPLNTFLTQTN